MLSDIHVKNFALIDEAELNLDSNLNVLTGETGAGKSILLGAVNLALGARTSKDAVKSGCEYALAEITFTDLDDHVKSIALDMGIDVDDGQLVVSRKLYSNGRNVVRINGETVNGSQTRLLTSHLIDIYGQNEHQSLLDSAGHLKLVDRYSGDKCTWVLEETENEYKKYVSAQKELKDFDYDPAALQREIDRLTFEINEIEDADIKEGEEEELKNRHKRLANARIINESISNAAAILYDSNGVGDGLNAAMKAVSRISSFDPSLSSFYDRLSDIDAYVSDLHRDLEDFLEDNPDDAEQLYNVEQRLDLISHLKSKYGNTVDEIRQFAEDAAERLDKLLNHERLEKETRKKLTDSAGKLEVLYEKLTLMRRETAKQLEEKITEALLQLNFNQVIFKIDLSVKEGYSAQGRDVACIMISLNPGEQPRPLDKIASGGELSRIMLAIKSVMAARDDIGTLIFDEIDTGISGRTAQKVAEKLAVISSGVQVVCITHLPQLASMADTHFYIEKSADDEHTSVSVTRLTGDRIVDELSRMLSGAKITEGIRESAREMLELAVESKILLRK